MFRIVGLLLASFWVLAFNLPAQSEPFQVGAILALSGEAGNVGTAIQNGMLLAYEELNPAVRARIKLNFEDDRCDPKLTLSAFERLLGQKRLALAISASSGVSKALAPIAERKSVPLVAIASDPEIVRQRQWVVNFWVTPEAEAELALSEAQRRGYRNVARITTMQQGFLSIREQVDRANQGRLKFILDEEYPPELKDARPFFNKVRLAPAADAILLLTVPGQTGLFAKQAREVGPKQPFFGIESFEDPTEVKVSGGALLDQWYVNADQAGTDLISRLTKRFPGSATWGAGNGYDVVLLIAAALESGATTPDAVNRFLHEVQNFKGALGQYSATGDNRFSLAAAVMLVKAAAFVKLEQP